MLQAVQRYLRTAVRFPKRGTATVRTIRTTSIVCGSLALLQVWIWFGKWWSAVIWILIALMWFAQAAVAMKELRRRTSESAET
jgi:hypothetical protein